MTTPIRDDCEGPDIHPFPCDCRARYPVERLARAMEVIPGSIDEVRMTLAYIDGEADRHETNDSVTAVCGRTFDDHETMLSHANDCKDCNYGEFLDSPHPPDFGECCASGSCEVCQPQRFRDS